ncbi:MAG: hypothetical protein AB7F89_01275 [Pirellulaceae bacterium]
MLAHACRLACVLLLLATSGCAICGSCDDYTYSAEGGLWQRLDPVYGRVGSAFTPEVWSVDHGYVSDYVPGESSAEEVPAGDATPEPPADEPMAEPTQETSVLQVPELPTY